MTLRKEQLFRELAREHGIDSQPGVLDFLRGLKRLGSPRTRAGHSTLFVAGGLQRVETRDVDAVVFRLAGWRLEFSRLRAYADRTHLCYSLDGTLGSDVLRRSVTTIDIPNGRFSLGGRPVTDDRRPVTGGGDSTFPASGEAR